MAERRMFAKTIIDSDAFMDMPLSAQALYFHLSMRADDDGFVNNAKKIQRMIGASDDDCKLLVMKRFVLTFESGVIVIKHWRIHNYIQKDRYQETVYLKEKATLELTKNKAYTECIQNVSKVYPQVSIDKDSIVKLSKEKESKEKKKVSSPMDNFISKYAINVDNYSGSLAEMDFELLDKAFSESDWLKENYVSLSRICKDYEKIVGGYYKTYKKPIKKHFESERPYTAEDLSDLIDNVDDIKFN